MAEESDTSSASYESEEDCSCCCDDPELSELLKDPNFGKYPYQYEPVADLTAEHDEAADDHIDIDRLGIAVDEWCSCHNCTKMPTSEECKCCKELDKVQAKIQTAGDDSVQCITDHPGFSTVCMNLYVLETAYYEYRQRYDHLQEKKIHMRYQFIACRQLIRWCWGYVGKQNYVTLPACAVAKIRNKFQPPQDVGFKYPPLKK